VTGQSWLYALGALAALIAMALRIYEWQSGADDFDFLSISLPAILAVAFGFLWVRSRRSEETGS
jgi:hypothetical protein